MSETRTGTVRRIIEDRGFGFIRDDESREDLFFHASELVNVKFEDLKTGDRVAFRVGEHVGRSCCLDVVVEVTTDRVL